MWTRHPQTLDHLHRRGRRSLVARNGPAKRHPKLVSFKWRNRFVLGKKSFARGLNSYELKRRSVNRIFTGTRHRVDLSTDDLRIQRNRNLSGPGFTYGLDTEAARRPTRGRVLLWVMSVPSSKKFILLGSGAVDRKSSAFARRQHHYRQPARFTPVCSSASCWKDRPFSGRSRIYRSRDR
jgi:hypothetical protein